MLKRLATYLLSTVTIVVLLCVQVDMSRRTEEFSARKELRSGETGMFSRDQLPFSKFDPRSKTPQHIQRTSGNDLDLEYLLDAQTQVFSAFIAKNLGSFPRYHSAQIARKSKMFILHRMILI
jgi:hypothetical protein